MPTVVVSAFNVASFPRAAATSGSICNTCWVCDNSAVRFTGWNASEARAEQNGRMRRWRRSVRGALLGAPTNRPLRPTLSRMPFGSRPGV